VPHHRHSGRRQPATPVCFHRATGAGLEIYRNTKRYITVSALELGSVRAAALDSLSTPTLLARHTGETDAEHGGFDFNDAGSRTGRYDDLIRNGAPEGERRNCSNPSCGTVASKGMDVDAITDERRNTNGIAAK